MKHLKALIILLCALAGMTNTALADNNVALSVDADIPEGTTGHWLRSS